MNVTKKVAQYVENLGINLSELSRQTGIPYMPLYKSMKESRELRADEFTAICAFLHVNPMDFA